MSNDTDLFFKACREGSTVGVNTFSTGRDGDEKIQGALLCYQYGHKSLGHCIVEHVSVFHAAQCLEQLLHADNMRVAYEVLNEQHKRLPALFVAAAAHNCIEVVRALLKGYIASTPQYGQKWSYTVKQALEQAVAHQHLAVLDAICPDKTEAEISEVLRTALDKGCVAAVGWACPTAIPVQWWNAVTLSAIHHKSSVLVQRMLEQFTLQPCNASLETFNLLSACTARNWMEPVRDYFTKNPWAFPSLYQHAAEHGARLQAWDAMRPLYEHALLTKEMGVENAPAPLRRI